MTIVQLTAQVKGEYIRTKYILTTISTEKFRELFFSASKEDQELLIKYINAGNKEQIKKWINKEAGEVSIMKLRKLAEYYGIKNYRRLTGHQLMLKLQTYLSQDQIIESTL